MEPSTATRRACFVEENHGLASIAAAGADIEAAGFSGNHFISRPLCNYSVSSPRNRVTNTNFTLRRNFSSVSSPRSARFCDSRFEEHHHHQPHFLDSCSFCHKPIGEGRDIFMYRGDTPFCSEECRQEQIEIDEAKEKDFNFSSMKAMRKKEQSKSPNKNTQKCPFRTGAVAAA